MSISGFARIFGSRRDEFSPSKSSVFSLMQSRSDCSCYDGLSWTVSLVPSASVFAVFDLLSGEEVFRRDRVADVSDVDLRCFTQSYSTEDRPLLMASYSEKD